MFIAPDVVAYDVQEVAGRRGHTPMASATCSQL